jgi:aldehyde:ferredoxin oxidoreductase
MATPGFAGKILLVDLSTKAISTIDSARYEIYGGGHGTATAIFWDLCIVPGDWDLQDAFDPRNIVALMTGPLAGTGLAFAARTSVSGLAPQTWPVNWFATVISEKLRPALKFAGWDGVVRRRSNLHQYRERQCTIADARPLWGLTVWETGRNLENGEHQAPVAMVPLANLGQL